MRSELVFEVELGSTEVMESVRSRECLWRQSTHPAPHLLRGLSLFCSVQRVPEVTVARVDRTWTLGFRDGASGLLTLLWPVWMFSAAEFPQVRQAMGSHGREDPPRLVTCWKGSE